MTDYYEALGMNAHDKACDLIEDEYDANRLEDLKKMRDIQQDIQTYYPKVGFIMMMCLVNVLYKYDKSKSTSP